MHERLRPAQARRIFQGITRARRVALSLADDLEDVIEVVAHTMPDILHLGTVPEALGPEAVVTLKARFPDLKLMRTIPAIDEQSLLLAQQYDGLVEYLLLDTYQPGDTQVGATGASHDWDLSRRIVSSVRTPVILAGGLGSAERGRRDSHRATGRRRFEDAHRSRRRPMQGHRAGEGICADRQIASTRPRLIALNPDGRDEWLAAHGCTGYRDAVGEVAVVISHGRGVGFSRG